MEPRVQAGPTEGAASQLRLSVTSMIVNSFSGAEAPCSLDEHALRVAEAVRTDLRLIKPDFPRLPPGKDIEEAAQLPPVLRSYALEGNHSAVRVGPCG